MKSTLASLLLAGLCLAVQASPQDDSANTLFERCYQASSAYSPMGLSWDGDYSRNDQLDDLSLVEDLPLLLDRILDSEPGAPPFFAHTSYTPDDQLIMLFASPSLGGQA